MADIFIHGNKTEYSHSVKIHLKNDNTSGYNGYRNALEIETEESQYVAGIKSLNLFLNDPEVLNFLEELSQLPKTEDTNTKKMQLKNDISEYINRQYNNLLNDNNDSNLDDKWLLSQKEIAIEQIQSIDSNEENLLDLIRLVKDAPITVYLNPSITHDSAAKVTKKIAEKFQKKLSKTLQEGKVQTEKASAFDDIFYRIQYRDGCRFNPVQSY